MIAIIAICAVIGFALVVGIALGIVIERDRDLFLSEPRTRATRRQLRQWRRDRLPIATINRRRA